MSISRRKLLLGVGALGVLGAAYSRLLESSWLEVREVAIRLPRARLSAPLRILHLSDLHYSAVVPLALIEQAIRSGLQRRPELICVTGDFITAGEALDLKPYGALLRALPAAAPAVAVLGNHDGGSWSHPRGGPRDPNLITGMLEEAGFVVLHNASRVLEVAGSRIGVAGVADLWAGGCDPQAAFQGLQSEEVQAIVALAHNPDTKDALEPHPWDLMLCGHTHGGQVVLPLLGPPIVPVRDRGFVSGLHAWKGRSIYTTRGVGSLYGIRFHCRPEVSLLDVLAMRNP